MSFDNGRMAAANGQHLGGPEPRFVPPLPGTPTPPHEKANRCLRNQRMREELQVTLCHGQYEAGLQGLAP